MQRETEKKYNFNYFGSFSRDGLKILKYMVEKHPKKLTFTNDELGKIVSLKDRALGGVLGAFSKRKDNPLIIKVGTVMVGWEGKFNRPKQVWALNPKLKKEEISKIKESLEYLLLD